VGDCYVVKLAGFVKAPDAQHPYGVLRVVNVAPDHLELRLGTYAYSRPSGADRAIRAGDLARADYFGPTPVLLATADLARLKQQRTIYAVRR
jgi:hypothetical protein